MSEAEKIRIAVIEDDRLFAENIQEQLLRYEKEQGTALSVTVFCDGEELLSSYGEGFDILLMDIELPGIDGMAAAGKVRERDSEAVIIFITCAPQYAIKGYSVGALDYLLKPVTYFALSERLHKAISRIGKQKKRYIVVSARGETRKLDVSRICYIESRDHLLTFHAEDGDFSSYGRIQDMERELAGEAGPFYRCNKGCLVNLEHIDAIRDHCAVVRGDMLPISRSRKAGFMDALNSYVKGVLHV